MFAHDPVLLSELLGDELGVLEHICIYLWPYVRRIIRDYKHDVRVHLN